VVIGKLRYAVSEIRENGDRPTWWQNRLAARVVGPMQSRLHTDEFRVTDEEWDTLVVLDGCRVDLFEETVDTGRFDEYGTRTSAGSATNEWTRANFAGEAMTDTVYVTGNPVVSREVRTAFHRFVEVWRDSFDPEIGTVHPDDVTEAALAAHEAEPDKRLVVHYLQPHYPFVGHPDLRYAAFGNTDELTVDGVQEGAKDVWEALGLGLVDEETVWAAYRENLELVMASIEPLLAAREGRTVVTSDHGNLLGERVSALQVPLYGHPPNVHHPAIREVPWAVTETGDRDGRDGPETSVEAQLQSLGYTA
jgi:hypothetical protein